ncbi:MULTISPECIES: NADH:flavin oxidoreductase [Paenibacillus]|uniref:12-oxophytodienoate reductase n=1 Tax=Paenibacillus campinasensis TaxID=66347 RepID=A0ABW9T734_9BACL|nr:MULTISPECIES: NADH:flavin oxidoreductase [Paenibacillus]MUG68548.1 12-oxophytodienoate reductase [Paenibacillus campinasensis]PAK55950.1 12-oxophytodienoate reductase [Paenibacillus sp. 7541]
MNTSQSVQALFQPVTIGNMKLPSRIVMAPMTRGFSPGGIPGPDVAAYYRRRAENGVGLIVTEGTIVNHPEAHQQPGVAVPHFYGEQALAGWSKVVSEVHEAGGKVIPQLWHMGLNPDRSVNELTEAEIRDIVEAFAQAAADAKRIGFDGIELHGAHGYLIDQFFWEKTNQRTDRYGGDIVARTRFAVEVIEACRQAVGPDYPIVLRISQWKGSDYSAKLAETPEQLGQFLAPLVEAGVDIFHCSTRRFWQPEFDGSELNLAGWVKQLTGKPTITVGSIGLDSEVTSYFSEGKGAEAESTSIDKLISKLDRQEFDLVAVGRALLVDPAWAAKLRDGRWSEMTPFTPEAAKVLY